jgi:hypothetical protein
MKQIDADYRIKNLFKKGTDPMPEDDAKEVLGDATKLSENMYILVQATKLQSKIANTQVFVNLKGQVDTVATEIKESGIHETLKAKDAPKAA